MDELLINTSENEVDKKVWKHVWLPRWAYGQLPNFWNSPDKVVGPAFPWAYASLCVTWVWFLCLALLATQFTSCDGSLASYDLWLPIVSIPIVLCATSFELRAARYTLAAQVKAIGPFNIMGIPLSFHQWLFMVSILCFLGHADTITNTLFWSKSVTTHTCIQEDAPFPRRNKEDIFAAVMKESMYGWLMPLVVNVGLANITTVAWGLMLLQPLYAVLAATPTKAGRERLRNDPCMEPPKSLFGYWTGGGFRYRSFLYQEQTFAVGLASLAEAGRMVFVMQEYNAMSLEAARTAGAFSNPLPRELQRTEFGFLLRGFLEIIVFLNLQGTDLAVTAAATGIVDNQVVASIVLCFLATLYNLYKENTKIFKGCEMLREQKEHYQENQRTRPNISAYDLKQVEKSVSNHALGNNVKMRFIVYDCLFGLLGFYAIKKCVMIFWCDDRVWNLGGCVDLSGLRAS